MKQTFLSKYLFISLSTMLLTACEGPNNSSSDASNGTEFNSVNKTATPNTFIDSSLISANSTNATFYFSSSTTLSIFRCRLNDLPFTPCYSPMQYTSLTSGNHSFAVQATNFNGNTDPTPAISQWSINSTALSDPLYFKQWHLKNTIQTGEDINIEPLWNRCTDDSCKGEGVRIAVVDNGLEITHEDLATNIVADKSYNYTNFSTTPAFGDHGTSVAGIIAARDNSVGVVGVASRAELVGYDLLKAPTNLNEIDAMTRDVIQNHVSNNSWGPADNTATLVDSSTIWRTAIDTGHTTGRNGLGTIYVWAAGNGHESDEDSNYDGYANYRGVIATGAVTYLGQRAYYSEQGANLLISAPGGEGCSGVVTSDLTGSEGYNTALTPWDDLNKNYTNCFAGTSAATPIVSGVVALILQANPNLGWRDVHVILARSARHNDPTNPDWQTNSAGLSINHNYGFGVVDAEAAVLLAENWVNLEEEQIHSTNIEMVNQAIGDNNGTSVTSTLNVASSGIHNIEFIEIYFSAQDHPHSGDLEITLVNQSTGTSSRLANTHTCNDCVPYSKWRFGSTRHLGEAADGNWQLIIEDKAPNNTGTFQSWQLIFYGT